ncbi:MAG: nuclease [Nocardioidaceae bacterium]|nr:nuclease [Nocardioidaceae bacterium]
MVGGSILSMATGVLATIAAMGAQLSEVAARPVWSLSGDELATGLRALARLRAVAAELELRLAHQATLVGVGSEVGAADTQAWWSNTTRQTRRDTHRRLAVAAALDRSRSTTREAMARGDVAEDQATVIVRALEALPDDLDAAVVERAEKELVRLAEHHDAADLTRLGKRILDVVAPEMGDEQERRVLEREEETAAQTARFTMTDDGHGRCHGRFTLPSMHGAMLRKVLLGLASPRRTRDIVPKPGPERMGRAFAEYVERYPTDRLRAAGGVAASVVVTMTLSDLTSATNQPALLDTGHSITAGEARRLACEAGIVPVVLDGASRPLDVGRS